MMTTPTPTVNIAHHRIPLSKVLTGLSVTFLTLFVGAAIVWPAMIVNANLTLVIMTSCLLLFLLTVTSCYHLIGPRGTMVALLVAIPFGWFAEHTGVNYGWFFSKFVYTDLMGPKLGDVPIVVPPMWFSLTYIGSIIANLIVHKSPIDPVSRWSSRFTLCLLGAFIVTAYDLSADPFMIHIKGWIMEDKRGDYYGEPVQGFVGWVIVSFIIMITVRTIVGKVPRVKPILIRRIDSLIPVGAYFALLMTFVVAGHPVETRSVAVFAMGIPVIAALAGYEQWRSNRELIRPGSNQ